MTTNQDEIARRIVDREVRLCLSSLVSTLAEGYGRFEAAYYSAKGGPLRDSGLGEVFEQAFELAAPIPDYEEAAREAGWAPHPTVTGAWSREAEKSPCGRYIDVLGAASAQEACEEDGIEPYDREVFEHWAVSSWLADKLEAKGEKVDRDFAGMIVWARTTTGQAIYCDSVLQDIARDLTQAASDAA